MSVKTWKPEHCLCVAQDAQHWIFINFATKTFHHQYRRVSFFHQRISCPTSAALWIFSARVEEKAGHLIKARSILEKARQRNPGMPELWLEAVRVENRAGLKNVAQSLMAKGEEELVLFLVQLTPIFNLSSVRSTKSAHCVVTSFRTGICFKIN